MPVIKCPQCRKSLKVGDASVGKRIRCPSCQNPFVVPGPAPELEEVQAVQTERPTRRPRRDIEEDEERPRPSRRARDDDEEEERPRRPRKRRPRDDDDDDDRDAAPSSAPLVYAILSCVFSCAPIIGLILGRIAMSKAEQEMARFPGRRYRDARKQLQIAKTIGIIGMCLSGIFLLIGIAWRILDRAR
jgi:hypothetical protein